MGLKRLMNEASSLSYASCDSCGRTTRLLVRPCFKLFCEEMALPSAVMGPFDLAPLIRAVAALLDIQILLVPAWHARFVDLGRFSEVLLQIQVEINF